MKKVSTPNLLFSFLSMKEVANYAEEKEELDGEIGG